MENKTRTKWNLFSKSRTRAILTARTLDLSGIAAVGLDLDHTLAVYNEQRVNELALEETCRNLIQHKAYPAGIGSLRYESSAVARGLVLDTGLGGVLKCDCNGLVNRAFGGGAWMSPRDIRARYGGRPLDLASTRFETIDSTFDLPSASLFGVIEGSLRTSGAAAADYGTLCRDIREMLDRTHTLGALKQRVVADIGSMIEPKPDLREKMVFWRAAGKKFFLLTNSGLEYTVAVLDQVFASPDRPVYRPPSWSSLFDLVVVEADKPRFFQAGGDSSEFELAGERPGFVRGGSASRLESLLGVNGHKVFYIGDNPVDDGAAALGYGWRTGLVVPELEGRPRPAAPDGGAGRRPGPIPDGDWGDVLWEKNTPTRFAKVIQENADLHTGRVENFFYALPDSVLKPG